MTGPSVVLEQNINLRQQQADWQAAHGVTLSGRWVRIVRPGHADRFQQQGVDSGESGEDPTGGAEVVATFIADGNARPLADWLASHLYALPPVARDTHEWKLAESGLSGSSHPNWLVHALGRDANQRKPPIRWPQGGRPPIPALKEALSDYRASLFADGAAMGELGVVLDLYELLQGRGLDRDEFTRVVAPWREGQYEDGSHVLQATVHATVDAGEPQAVFELFRAYSARLTEEIARGASAQGGDFHEWLYELAPLAHAAVVLGKQMLREPWLPDSARGPVGGRLHTAEEYRVRILDGVVEHLDNLRFAGAGWQGRVAQLCQVEAQAGHASMLRRAKKMCGQLMLYPPGYMVQLVADVGVNRESHARRQHQ